MSCPVPNLPLSLGRNSKNREVIDSSGPLIPLHAPSNGPSVDPPFQQPTASSLFAMASYPRESGGSSSCPTTRNEPISFSEIVEGCFYLVKLRFPRDINEASPLRHRVTVPGVPPVFGAPRLDAPTSSGIWKSTQGPNYYRPCLITGLVFLFLASTNPSFQKCWLPLESPLSSQSSQLSLTHPVTFRTRVTLTSSV